MHFLPDSGRRQREKESIGCEIAEKMGGSGEIAKKGIWEIAMEKRSGSRDEYEMGKQREKSIIIES